MFRHARWVQGRGVSLFLEGMPTLGFNGKGKGQFRNFWGSFFKRIPIFGFNGKGKGKNPHVFLGGDAYILDTRRSQVQTEGGVSQGISP